MSNAAVCVVFTLLLLPSISLASSGGIFGRSTSGCTGSGCHDNGGSYNYNATITGTFNFENGSVSNKLFTFRGTKVNGTTANGGGFNLSVTAGTLDDISSTYKINSTGNSREATHQGANFSNLTQYNWTVRWDIPSTTGTYYIRGCFNPVNQLNGNSGDGDYDCTGSFTYPVTVYDQPVVGSVNQNNTYTEGSAAQTVDTFITITDIDSNNFNLAQVEISGNYKSGDILTCSSCAANSLSSSWSSISRRLTITPAFGAGTRTEAQYESALSSVKFSSSSDDPGNLDRTIRFRVRDSGNNLSVYVSTTINVTPVNDLPVIGSWTTTQTYTEGGAAKILDTFVTITDPDHNKFNLVQVLFDVSGPAQTGDQLFCPSPAITDVSCAGNGSTFLTLTNANGNDNEIDFENALEAIRFSNSTQNPGNALRVIRARARDISNGLGAFVFKNLTVIDVNDLPSIGSWTTAQTYTENGAAKILDTFVTVTDVDHDKFILAEINFDLSGPAQTGDQLFCPSPAITDINCSGNGTQALLLTNANANDNEIDFENAFEAIKFSNATDNPGNATRVIRARIQDGAFGQSSYVFKNLTITEINDPPTSIGFSGDNIAYIEDTVKVIDTNVTLSDAEGHTFSSVVVRINNFVAGQDVLNCTANALINCSFVSGVLTLQSTNAFNRTASQYTTVLRTVTYENISDSPTTTTRTLQLEMTDTGSNSGLNDNTSTPVVKTMSVSAVNDRPTSQSTSFVVLEDIAKAFSAGNFSFTDPDSGSSLSAVVIEVLPLKGDLQLSGSPVLAGQSIPVGGLTQLTYKADTNENGNGYATFRFEVTDNTATANNTSTGNYIMTINVTPQNDAPTASSNTVGTTEDNNYGFNVADFGFADVDAHTFNTLRIESLPSNGTLIDNGVPVSAASMIVPHSVPAANLGTLIFQPDAEANGVPYTSFLFDVVDSGSTNRISTGNYVMTVNVSAVNDRPTSGNDFINAIEDTDYNFTVGEFVYSDNDGDTLTSLRIESLPSSGTLKYNGSPVVSTPFVATNISSLAFRADNNDNGNSYASFQFEVIDSSGVLNTSVGNYIMTVNVAAINDSPLLNINANASVEELGAVVLSNGNLSATDVDNSNASLTYTVTAIPGNGVLRKSATIINNSDTFTQGDINDGLINYTQTTNVGSPILDNFIFDVKDTAGTGPTSQIFTIDITLNSNPTISAGGILNYTEDDVATAISAVVVGDSDNDQITGATVQITINFQSGEDVLDFVNQNGISGSFNVGIMTLTGTASVANYQMALASVAYSNTSQNPVTTARTVNYRVTDDFGLQSTAATATINVARATDLPTSSNDSINAAEDTDYVFSTGDFVFNDIDGDSLASVVIELLPTPGTLKYNGSAITGGQLPFTATNIALLAFRADSNDNGNSYASFQFEVKDDSVSNNTSAGNYQMTVNVSADNDTPTVDINNNASVEELSSVILNAGNLSSSDAEDADTSLTYTVTALPGFGVLMKAASPLNNNDTFTQGDINADQISYNQTSNAGSPVSDSFDFSLRDAQAAGPVAQTFTIDITLNSNPIVTAGGVLNYVEDDVAMAISSVTVTDSDNDLITGATAQITANFQSSEDVLSFIPQNGINGSYNAGTMTLSGTSSAANYQMALASVAYSNNSQDPIILGRTVTYIVTDDFGLSSLAATATINVANSNDAPTLDVNAGLTSKVGTEKVITSSELLSTDIEDTAANITYTVTTPPTKGALSSNTFTQQDIANGAVMYTAGAIDGADSFIFDVDDQEGAGPTAQVFNITISANDPPTIVAGGTLNYSENQAAQFIDSTISITDSDDTLMKAASVQITSNFASGEDVLACPAPVAGISCNSSVAGTLSFTSATNNVIADYQTVLAGITYFNTSDDPDVLQRTVTYTVMDDFGNVSSGANALINVAAQNDEPTAVNNIVATVEDTPLAILVGDFNFADVDSADSLQSVTIVAAPLTGSLDVTGTGTVVNGTVVPLVDLSGNLMFTPAQNEFGNPNPYATFTFRVNDGTALSLTTYIMNINVSADNDVPTISNNAQLAVIELGSGIISSTQLLTNDVDDTAVNLTYTVTALPQFGEVRRNNVALLLNGSFTQDDINTNKVAYLNTVASQTSDSFVFKVEDDDNVGPVGLTFNISISQNAVPIVTAGGLLNYTENDAETVIDNNISISDADADDMQAAVVTITTNFQSGEDVLGCPAVLPGSIVCDDSVVGVITLNNSTTMANYETALEGITYNNTSEDPDTNARTVSYTVTDTFGNVSSADTAQINVVAQNDAPTATDNTVATVEDIPLSILAGDFNFADADSADSLQSVTIVTAPLLGSLDVTGTGAVSDGTVVPLADLSGNLIFTPIQDAFGNPDPYATFTFRVNDGVALSDNSYTMSINVSADNDVPTLDVNAGLTAKVNVLKAITSSQLLATDVEDAASDITYTVTSPPTKGTLSSNGFSQQDIIDGTVSYTAGAISGSDSFIFDVDDLANAGPTAQVFNITISANDPPVIVAGATLSYNENQTAQNIDASITITDSDDTLMKAASVQITTNFANAEDVLACTVVVAGITCDSSVAGTLTFTSAANNVIADYQTILAGITYFNSSDDPDELQRTVTYIITDDFGNLSTGGVALINVSAQNDAPTAANNTVATAEDTPLSIIVSDFNFADVDSADSLQSVTIVAAPLAGSLDITGTGNVADNTVVALADLSGNLVFTPTANEFGNPDPYTSFTFRVNDGTALSAATYTMNINVSSVNDVPTVTNNLLLAVVELGDSVISNIQLLTNDVDDVASNLTYTVTTLPLYGDLRNNGSILLLNGVFTQADINTGKIRYFNTAVGQASDGFGFKVEDDDNVGPTGFTFNISINQNAVPTITASGTLSFTENDVATVIDNSIAINDADGDDMQGATVIITSGLQVGEDVLACPAVLLGIVCDDSVVGTITLSNITTMVNYESVLSAITYANTSENPNTSQRTVTYTVEDNFGNNSIGSTAIITVAAVNDAPTSSNAVINAVEDIAFNFTSNEFSFNDIDGDSLVKIQITVLPAKGVLKQGVSDVTVNQEIAAAILNSLNYQAVLNESGAAYSSFSFKVHDGVTFSDTANTITVNVSAVNDPATLDINAGINNVPELGSMAISAAVLSASDVEDVDPADISYTVTVAPVRGVITVGAVSPANSFTQAQLNAGDVSYVHNSAGVFTDSFIFTVQDTAATGPVGQVFNIGIVPNAEPVINAGAILAYEENAPATAIDTILTIIDPNADAIKAASIIISAGYESAEDVLSFVNQNAITGSYNAVSGVLTLTGNDSINNYQAALRSVAYENTSDQPSLAVRTIQYTATDVFDNVSIPANSTVEITAVNDLPVIDIHTTVELNPVLPVYVEGVVLPPSSIGIPATVLHAIDFESSDSNLVYSFINYPSAGDITLNGATLFSSNTFTQQDVNAGNVAFTTSTCAFASESFAVMVKDESDGESSAETVTIATVDTDGDGMNDCFEDLYGLDKGNPADASLDTDGDGLTNIEEFQQGKNPQIDDAGPVIIVPADIVIDATGYFTPIDVGEATAIDLKDGVVTVSHTIEKKVGGVLVNGEALPSGAYNVIWEAVDFEANVSSVIQTLDIRPLANLSFDQYSSEGQTAIVTLMLSGAAPEYPVSLNYTLSGTADILDYSFALAISNGVGNVGGGVISIDSGNNLSFTVDIIDDNETEIDETIILDISNPINAALGANIDHSITITENNIAPAVMLEASQLGRTVNTAYQSSGAVIVTANASDANGDALSYDWSASDADLKIAITLGGTAIDDNLVFDPDTLLSGRSYLIDLIVSDDAVTSASTHSTMYVYIKPVGDTPVLLATDDTDSDGNDDANEGFGDSDLDGIPDYLDALDTLELVASNQVVNNSNINVDAALFIQTDAGLTIGAGPIALAAGKNGALINQVDIENYGGVNLTPATNIEDAFVNNGGYFNFEISGLTPLQDVAHVVIPLQTFVLADSIYRKYWPGIGWVDFVVDDKNKIMSAPGIFDSCPAPGSNLYVEGLAIFTYCIQLTIEDGGPNDLDGEKNGRIIDPGGVGDELAAEVDPNDAVKKVSNGGLNQWFIGLFLLIIYLRSRSVRSRSHTPAWERIGQ